MDFIITVHDADMPVFTDTAPISNRDDERRLIATTTRDLRRLVSIMLSDDDAVPPATLRRLAYRILLRSAMLGSLRSHTVSEIQLWYCLSDLRTKLEDGQDPLPALSNFVLTLFEEAGLVVEEQPFPEIWALVQSDIRVLGEHEWRDVVAVLLLFYYPFAGCSTRGTLRDGITLRRLLTEEVSLNAESKLCAPGSPWAGDFMAYV